MGRGVGIVEDRDCQFSKELMEKIKDLSPEYVSMSALRVGSHKRYRVIIDRLSFQDRYMREYLKLASLGGSYVINNPFSSDTYNKLVEIILCQKQGIPTPKTVMLPMIGKDEEDENYATSPDWEKITEEFQFPVILKPYDGASWDHVYKVSSLDELKKIYSTYGQKLLFMVQEKIEYTQYYRAFCVGQKEVLFMNYQPAPGGFGVYSHVNLENIGEKAKTIHKWTVYLNSCADFDLNSVEWCIDSKGNPYLIEGFNEVPDIDKTILPKEEYGWLVEKMSELIREKHNSEKTNKNPFEQSKESF
ncbi:MAG: hypothetical protein ABH950_04575 [Candidatus Altiarchaeota archaeon]